MHYLPDKKLRHCYVFGYGTDRMAEIVVNDDLDLSKIFSSFLNITIRISNWLKFAAQ